ncbi:beta-lactamase family protein [Verrucomicrobiales bacterium]|nr:beta-lactamase family protein [Verrucomicrobiales bacterium]
MTAEFSFSTVTLAVAILSTALISFAQDTPQFEKLFERCDSNSDGKLTLAEAEATGRKTNWLALADTNNDAAVTLAEVREHFRKKATPPAPSEGPLVIEKELPKSSPVSLSGLKKAGAYSADRNGETFLVMSNGKVIYERYDGGWDFDRPHRLASGTKSFSAALLAAGAKDNLLSLDELVSDTISEWKKDEDLSTVTIRQLLNLSSGIHPGKVGTIPAYADTSEVNALSPPEEKFRYGPAAFQVFGELLTQKLKARDDLNFADPLAYLEARVFEPIGLTHGLWRRDENGMPHLPSGAHLTAREWAKYGEFLRQGGSWGGKQLVDPEVLSEAVIRSKVNPDYGISFWLVEKGANAIGIPPWGSGSFMAAGAGKQRLYILPQKGIVVVRQGESRKFDDGQFLNALFSSPEE